MKHSPKLETENSSTKTHQPTPPPPPPPPPVPRFWARKTVTESVTNKEIAKFWRQKRIQEEDHLLAAIKAAARIRARNLSEEDYKQFIESLKDHDDTKENNTIKNTKDEVRVGIRDWWTKSMYAYLNQPTIKSTDAPIRRASSYTPNCFSFKATPVYPTSFGMI